MSPTQAPNSLVLLLSALLLSSSAVAIGDFLCVGQGSQSCLAWSQDPLAQGSISATAVCQPDPVNPAVSYCGYAHATCSTGADCDYGSCISGTCSGFLGDACTLDVDCQAFFFCGTDGTCGGTGSRCNNGLASSPIPFPDRQCTSNTCNLTEKSCSAPPVAGMPLGSICGNDDVCASGFCSSSICALGPSQGSRKVKRYVLNGSGPNVSACPTGQTACAVGAVASDGFECIDSQTNLERCGGCVGDGQGQDCTAIHGVESVTCAVGRCVVVSCAPGLNVSADGSTCVPWDRR